MLVAPGMAQRMPESLCRWPMTALHPASTAPGADEHAQAAEVGVAHPVGAVLEVGQLLVAFASQRAGELQVPSGGEQGGDITGAGFGEALGEPVRVTFAQEAGGEVSEAVDVLAGVVEVDDLGGGGK
jgi:hypothetical protein